MTQVQGPGIRPHECVNSGGAEVGKGSREWLAGIKEGGLSNRRREAAEEKNQRQRKVNRKKMKTSKANPAEMRLWRQRQ